MRGLSHAPRAGEARRPAERSSMTTEPIRRQARTTAAAVLLTLVATGGVGTTADATVEGLQYRLSFAEAGQRIMQVDLVVPPVSGPVELVMSRSSPGRYAL